MRRGGGESREGRGLGHASGRREQHNTVATTKNVLLSEVVLEMKRERKK